MTAKETHQPDLVSVLLRCGALLTGEFELRDGRISPYFVDFGTIPDGDSLSELGECYARKILEEFGAGEFDLVFGPAYKGIPIAVATVTALAKRGINKKYAFDRKSEKTYGEKSRFIGGKLEPGLRVLIIDDVITSGGTKIEIIDTLKAVPGIEIVGVVVGVDRTEDPAVVAEFEHRTGLELKAICTIGDIEAHLRSTQVAA